MNRSSDVTNGKNEGVATADPKRSHCWLLAQLRLAEGEETQRVLLEVVNMFIMQINGALALGLTEPARLVRRKVRSTRSLRCRLNTGDAIFSICLTMKEQREPGRQ